MTGQDLIDFEEEIKGRGRNHHCYKDGRSLKEYYCLDCDKLIGWYAGFYGSGKCNSCVKKGRKHKAERVEKIMLNLRQFAFKKGHKTNTGKVPWNKNKKYSTSEEARLRNKNSKHYFKQGELHPNWKGGVSLLNDLIRGSEEFNRWRKDIYAKSNYRCVVCDSNNTIEAHHIIPLNIIIERYGISSLEEAYKCPQLWNRNNGETRCYNCHKSIKVGQLKN